MSDLLTDDEEAFFSKFPERIQVRVVNEKLGRFSRNKQLFSFYKMIRFSPNFRKEFRFELSMKS